MLSPASTPSTTPDSPARSRFLALLVAATNEGRLVKLTLGKYRGPDTTLRNLYVRPVALKEGHQLSFLFRHATRDVTKNHATAEALRELDRLIGAQFLDAHLFTESEIAQLECESGGVSRLRVTKRRAAVGPERETHDRTKVHPIPARVPWLRALGVTNEQGRPREDMADKFRQIQKFAELLGHLVSEAFPERQPPQPGPVTGTPPSPERAAALSDASPLRIMDMGAGKGYLTFAIAALLGDQATVKGIEARRELVELCNRIACDEGFSPRLEFLAGTIADSVIDRLDVLIALHACDTATDDALAKGIGANAKLIVVSPCCQKELRHQLVPPPVLAGALRHGIFRERQAEFVTDALRAELLEWAGYRTKVFEFVSTEHTAKNLMIAAIKSHPAGDAARAGRVRDFAKFYGIRQQRLAGLLGFPW